MNNKNSQSAFALIKFFSQKEHYLSFLNGISLFRTPHYYRTCEDLGRGDRNESCVLFWSRKYGENKPKFSFLGNTDINFDECESVLIYPAAEQNDTWMQSWAIIGNHNGFENSLEQMKQVFGLYFVLLPANKITQYAKLVEKDSGMKVSYGAVRYSDNPTERSLTVKDTKFSYQKEFRFFTGECSKGKLKDQFLMLPELKSLLIDAQSLKLTLPNGNIKYCSVGYEGVVIV
ncbi:hypothetical protein NBRC116592_09040 [Colwellia sp. KU-HH00111]|uniref:hypothetical protein n=1 Tax=Colwellia sp. KU-HH00111 TaxID=3127652 RepID=UPI00310B98A0